MSGTSVRPIVRLKMMAMIRLNFMMKSRRLKIGVILNDYIDCLKGST
ncbi:7376_t:CDS:2 [Entrophospora sp. SA101]|nr:7376_t:CDS:2 [Entrophospora sp. SA101]